MTKRRSAVVLGATGHLGQAATRELLSRGWQVSAATRQAAPRSLDGLDVRLLHGDADTPGQLERWVAGHELVVDAAAPHSLGTYARMAARAYDPIAHARRRIRALLEAVEAHRAQLAFISSFTTLSRPGSGLDAEAQWRRQTYPYFAVKEAMEQMVLDAARTGLSAVVVNPTACLGPWEYRAPSSSFVGLVVSQRLAIVMRHVLNVIDVRDVASALLAAVEAERYGVPIGLSAHDVALDELARRLSELAGVRAPIPAEPRLAALFAFWAESGLALAGQDAPDVLRAVPLVADGRAMKTGSEQLALGVAVRPLDDTLRDAVQWHQSRHSAAGL
jgi:nucleoside-diphosphate-sugar epimerase